MCSPRRSLLSGLLLCSSLFAGPQETLILSIASSNSAAYLHTIISPVNARWFNLASTSDLDRAVLKDPVNVSVLTPEAADSWQQGVVLDAILVPSARWFVPVSVDDSVRFFIAVSDVGHGFERAASGFANLAADYGRAKKSAGVNRLDLIAVPQTGRYLFRVPGTGLDNLTPMGPVQSHNGEAAPPSASVNDGGLSAAIDLVRRECAAVKGGAH